MNECQCGQPATHVLEHRANGWRAVRPLADYIQPTMCRDCAQTQEAIAEWPRLARLPA
jgi:hypothetical protein